MLCPPISAAASIVCGDSGTGTAGGAGVDVISDGATGGQASLCLQLPNPGVLCCDPICQLLHELQGLSQLSLNIGRGRLGGGGLKRSQRTGHKRKDLY